MRQKRSSEAVAAAETFMQAQPETPEPQYALSLGPAPPRKHWQTSHLAFWRRIYRAYLQHVQVLLQDGIRRMDPRSSKGCARAGDNRSTVHHQERQQFARYTHGEWICTGLAVSLHGTELLPQKQDPVSCAGKAIATRYPQPAWRARPHFSAGRQMATSCM